MAMLTDDRDPVDCVDPFIDTAKPRIRWVFSVFTARPFGMVRLAPNTDPVGTWDAGYRWGSGRIAHLSHVHAWQLSGVPVMPTSGPPGDDVSAAFSHDDEAAGPGTYRVHLRDPDVRAELTATERVGVHRYTFPTGAAPHLVLDLGAELGPCAMADARVRQVDGHTFEGFVENEVTRRRNRRVRIWFHARIDRAIDGFHVAGPDGPGGRCDRLVVACAGGGGPLLLKVALSYVDADGARRNMGAEMPGWDFDAAVAASRRAWSDWLGRIQVEGGTPAARTKLYTDLWRALVGGHHIGDVDGRWRDQSTSAEGVVRTAVDAVGRPQPMVCGQDGFWHAQWSLSLLYSLVWPDLMGHYSRFLVELGSHGGPIPRGPSAGADTFVMLGAASTPWLVSSWLKGIRTFDVDAAYEGARRNAFPGGLMSRAGYEFDTCEGGGLEAYIEQGWIPDGRRVPTGMHIDGAAQTVEYAYQDACLARWAAALGHDEDARLFAQRSRSWRNLFDDDTRWLRPRRLDGTWWDPFDPLSLEGWCEANAWQYHWHPVHNLPELARRMGGRDAFVARLDEGFRRAEPHDFIAAKPDPPRHRAAVNYGNEPGRFVAHLFNHAGAPWRTQHWARAVQRQTFAAVTPMGYCEDDDQGKAAATSALLALGLFDVLGGCGPGPVWEITAPVFDRVTFHLHADFCRGRTFVIDAPGGDGDVYVQAAHLDGEPWGRCWFEHARFAAGGHLRLELGPTPNLDWGAAPGDAPPSMALDP